MSNCPDRKAANYWLRRHRIHQAVAMYGYSHQRQTLDYICIQPDEVREAYMKEI